MAARPTPREPTPLAMRAAGGLLGALVVAALLVWVLPGWLDWNRYRGTIASYAARALGRPVRIDGPIEVTLLPQPLVTAGLVRLGDRGDGIAMTAPYLRLRLAWPALLHGAVVPRQLVLGGPSITLPWPLPPASLTPDQPGWLGGTSAHVEHAVLTIGAVRLTGLDADLAAGGTDAPGLRVDGRAQWLGRHWRLSAHMGQADAAGAAPVDLTLQADPAADSAAHSTTDTASATDLASATGVPAAAAAPGSAPDAADASPPATRARLVGTLAASGAFTGQLSADAADLSRLIAAPALPVRLAGTVGFGAGPAHADLTLDLGGTTIAAKLRPLAQPFAQPPGASHPTTAGSSGQVLWLSTTRLDLDAWMHALMRHGSAAATRRGYRPVPALSEALIRLPGTTRLDLAAAAVALRGGTIRGVHAVLDLDAAGATLRDATATLPGDAALRLTGRLSAPLGTAPPATTPLGTAPPGIAPLGPALDGQASLDAPQLRATLDWLRHCGLALGPDLPSSVLRTASLHGRLQAQRGQLAWTELRGTIGDSSASGSIAVDPADGQLDADLTLDRLAGDDWWAPDGHLDWTATSRALAASALALRLHVGQMQLRGLTIDHLALDAATSAGGLAVNSAAFDLDGLHGTLAGTLGADGTLADARLDLGAASGAALAAHLPDWLPDWARVTDFFWNGRLRLHAEAVGPPDAVVASASLDLDDARLEAHPVFDLVHGRWTARLTLRHPGAPRLLAAIGWPHAGDWLGEGSLSLLAQLSGTQGQLRLDQFDLTAASLHAVGDLALDLAASNGGKPPMLSGHVAADTLPLPPFIPGSRSPGNPALLAGWNAVVDLTAQTLLAGDTALLHRLRTRIALTDGVLALDPIAATLSGGTLGGRISLDTSSAPPRIAIDTTLTALMCNDALFGTRLDISAAHGDAALSVTGQGYSVAAVIASLDGTLRAHLTDVVLAGLDARAAATAATAAPPDGAALQAALGSGQTRLDTVDLAARISSGLLALNHLAAAGPDGAVAVQGTADLAAGTVSLLAHLPAGLDVRLTGPAADPRRIAEPARLTQLDAPTVVPPMPAHRAKP